MYTHIVHTIYSIPTYTHIQHVYEWINASNPRHIFGVFLDITGAFDNVKWAPLYRQIYLLGASVGTLRIVKSYLTNRWAELKLEGIKY